MTHSHQNECKENSSWSIQAWDMKVREFSLLLVSNMIYWEYVNNRYTGAIVRTCKSCLPFLQVPPLQSPGVNPRGLKPNIIWQTDVTHYVPFGKLKYIFMSIDTYSHACWATAHSGEKAKHAESHFLQCFAILGLPQQIKTDNGPCFTSKSLQEFFNNWHIKHTTGTPYNPKGQAIIERHNKTLKKSTNKTKRGK